MSMRAYFAERDRLFRLMVTDRQVLHGLWLILSQSVTLSVKRRSRFGEIGNDSGLRAALVMRSPSRVYAWTHRRA